MSPRVKPRPAAITVKISCEELEIMLSIDAAIEARDQVHERPTVFMAAVTVD